MPKHVSFHYQYGIALHQDGLNRASAALRMTRPELFAHRTEIVVKPPDPGPPPTPGHTLTLYAVCNQPLAFSLYPIDAMPGLKRDSFFVSVDLSFSLTDTELGTVTRIGAVLEATGTIEIDAGEMRLRLLDFQVAKLRGEQPSAFWRIIKRRIDAGAAIELAYSPSDDDSALGRTFRAIVNYLINVFLEEALKKAIVEFPVPPLDQLVGFSQLGTLPIQALFIENRSLYACVGDDEHVPVDRPEGLKSEVDLRVGISASGLRRVVAAFLPIPIPLALGGIDDVLHVTSQELRVSDLALELIPGSERIPCRVNVGGLINLNVNAPIPIFGGRLRFTIPLPLDPLTRYQGGIYPGIEVDDPAVAGDDAQVRLQLRPDTDFLHAWYIFIVTDYRGFLESAFRRAAEALHDKLMQNKFCKIPIIGWIVCGVIDVLAPFVGYLLGFVLDLFVSSFLNLIANTIGRALLSIFVKRSFTVAHVDQKKLHDVVGMYLRSASTLVADNGRGGELELRAWFNDQGLPVPPAPAPLNPISGPPPPQEPSLPGAPELPEAPAASFQPALTFGPPAWSDGSRESYRLSAQSPDHGVIEGTTEVSYERRDGIWTLRHTARNAAGEVIGTLTGEYAADTFEPLRSEHVTIHGGQTTRQIVDYTAEPGMVGASLGIDGHPSMQRQATLRTGVPREFEELWVFRAARMPLDDVQGNFGRITLADPFSALNWVREIPVTLAVSAGTLAYAPGDGGPQDIEVWIVQGRDEERVSTAYIAKDGSGLLKLESSFAGAVTTLLRR